MTGNSLVIAGTGHRPQKLQPYSDQVLERLIDIATEYLEGVQVTKVISGMALGWDTALCIAALDLGIPVCAAIPCYGQELPWLLSDRNRYHQLLGQCSETVVAEEEHSFMSMRKRNEWMVDNCDRLLAFWDGSKGGTANTVRYATGKVEVVNLWGKFNRDRDFYASMGVQLKN